MMDIEENQKKSQINRDQSQDDDSGINVLSPASTTTDQRNDADIMGRPTNLCSIDSSNGMKIKPPGILVNSSSQASSLSSHYNSDQKLVRDSDKLSPLTHQRRSTSSSSNPHSPLAIANSSASTPGKATKIRFRCPSVDLVVSPSTATNTTTTTSSKLSCSIEDFDFDISISNTDSASNNSWDQTSPSQIFEEDLEKYECKSDFILKLYENNDVPISYSEMESTNHDRIAGDLEGHHEVFHEHHDDHNEPSSPIDVIPMQKKPLNGHFDDHHRMDYDEHHRRLSSGSQNGLHSDKSDVGHEELQYRKSDVNENDYMSEHGTHGNEKNFDHISGHDHFESNETADKHSHPYHENEFVLTQTGGSADSEIHHSDYHMDKDIGQHEIGHEAHHEFEDNIQHHHSGHHEEDHGFQNHDHLQRLHEGDHEGHADHMDYRHPEDLKSNNHFEDNMHHQPEFHMDHPVDEHPIDAVPISPRSTVYVTEEADEIRMFSQPVSAESDQMANVQQLDTSDEPYERQETVESLSSLANANLAGHHHIDEMGHDFVHDQHPAIFHEEVENPNSHHQIYEVVPDHQNESQQNIHHGHSEFADAYFERPQSEYGHADESIAYVQHDDHHAEIDNQDKPIFTEEDKEEYLQMREDAQQHSAHDHEPEHEHYPVENADQIHEISNIRVDYSDQSHTADQIEAAAQDELVIDQQNYDIHSQLEEKQVESAQPTADHDDVHAMHGDHGIDIEAVGDHQMEHIQRHIASSPPAADYESIMQHHITDVGADVHPAHDDQIEDHIEKHILPQPPRPEPDHVISDDRIIDTAGEEEFKVRIMSPCGEPEENIEAADHHDEHISEHDQSQEHIDFGDRHEIDHSIEHGPTHGQIHGHIPADDLHMHTHVQNDEGSPIHEHESRHSEIGSNRSLAGEDLDVDHVLHHHIEHEHIEITRNDVILERVIENVEVPYDHSNFDVQHQPVHESENQSDEFHITREHEKIPIANEGDHIEIDDSDSSVYRNVEASMPISDHDIEKHSEEIVHIEQADHDHHIDHADHMQHHVAPAHEAADLSQNEHENEYALNEHEHPIGITHQALEGNLHLQHETAHGNSEHVELAHAEDVATEPDHPIGHQRYEYLAEQPKILHLEQDHVDQPDPMIPDAEPDHLEASHKHHDYLAEEPKLRQLEDHDQAEPDHVEPVHEEPPHSNQHIDHPVHESDNDQKNLHEEHEMHQYDQHEPTSIEAHEEPPMDISLDYGHAMHEQKPDHVNYEDKHEEIIHDHHADNEPRSPSPVQKSITPEPDHDIIHVQHIHESQIQPEEDRHEGQKHEDIEADHFDQHPQEEMEPTVVQDSHEIEAYDHHDHHGASEEPYHIEPHHEDHEIDHIVQDKISHDEEIHAEPISANHIQDAMAYENAHLGSTPDHAHEENTQAKSSIIELDTDHIAVETIESVSASPTDQVSPVQGQDSIGSKESSIRSASPRKAPSSPAKSPMKKPTQTSKPPTTPATAPAPTCRGRQMKTPAPNRPKELSTAETYRRAQSAAPPSAIGQRPPPPAVNHNEENGPSPPPTAHKQRVEIQAPFGERGTSKRMKRTPSTSKKMDEEKEKEHRRLEAEAAYQAWLQRKAQERKRARSTGRGLISDHTPPAVAVPPKAAPVEEISNEEKQKRRAEAEAAFQAWLDRKKEEQKERKKALMAASKSMQTVGYKREDADEAFRRWKEQKEQQMLEERRLIEENWHHLETVIPLPSFVHTPSHSPVSRLHFYRRRAASSQNPKTPFVSNSSDVISGGDRVTYLPELSSPTMQHPMSPRRHTMTMKSRLNIRSVSPWQRGRPRTKDDHFNKFPPVSRP